MFSSPAERHVGALPQRGRLGFVVMMMEGHVGVRAEGNSRRRDPARFFCPAKGGGLS